jgi:hypothetical protein
MQLSRRAWHLEYETSTNIFSASLMHGRYIYAYIWRANLPGCIEAVDAEAQELVNAAHAPDAGHLSWPPSQHSKEQRLRRARTPQQPQPISS